MNVSPGAMVGTCTVAEAQLPALSSVQTTMLLAPLRRSVNWNVSVVDVDVPFTTVTLAAPFKLYWTPLMYPGAPLTETPGETTAVPLIVDGTPVVIVTGAVSVKLGVALTTVTVVLPDKTELPTVADPEIVNDVPEDAGVNTTTYPLPAVSW